MNLLVLRVLLCLHAWVCIDLCLRDRQNGSIKCSVNCFWTGSYRYADDFIIECYRFIQSYHIKKSLPLAKQLFASFIENHICGYRCCGGGGQARCTFTDRV